MKASTLRRGLNLWPPFLFAGIHVTEISPDWKRIRVELRMRPWNRNYVKTHFGGSLFAMTDPFRMIPVLRCLGRDYIVWDKAASIDFISPGKGPVHAEFRVDDELLAQIRQHTADGDKYLPELRVEVRDDEGTLVAIVHKTLYIRLKPRARQTA